MLAGAGPSAWTQGETTRSSFFWDWTESGAATVTSRGIVNGPEDRQFHKFRLTGSPRALGVVYDLVAPELLRVAAHLASDPLEAEDLVQRTFVTAIEKARNFTAGEPVLPWLMGILAFHAKNEKRRAARRPDPTRLRQRVPGQPIEEAQSQELDRHLVQALSKLPEEQRSVLTLRLRHHLSPAEIAEALGRPAGTIRSQLARGTQSLRHLLPAGLVASTCLAFGLPRGLSALRENLLHKATATPYPKLLAAKGYCSLALAPIAEALMMKKLIAALLLFAAILGTRSLLEPGENPATRALQLSSTQDPLPLAKTVELKSQEGAPQSARQETSLAQRESGSDADGREALENAVGSLRISLFDHAGNTVQDEICLLTSWDPVTRASQTTLLRIDGHGTAMAHEIPVGYVRVQALRSSVVTTRVHAGEVTELEIRLPLGIEVRGHVIDKHGKPVPHAQIWLSKRDLSREGFEVKRADGAGRFLLQSVSKDNYVAAFAPGFGLSYLQAPRGALGASTDMRIVLDIIGSQVEVEVLDTNGKPIEGAEVVIGNLQATPFRDLGNGLSAPPPAARRGKTDSTGAVTLTSVPIGAVPLWVRCSGFGTARGELQVRANVPQAHTIRMAPEAQVFGRIRKPDGTPSAGSDVWSGTRHRFDSSVATSDSEGNYQLDGLPAGDVLIRAEVNGHGLAEVQVNLYPGETRQLDISAEVQPRIHGQLVSDQDKPLREHVVVAMSEDGRRMVDSDTTSADGSFHLLVEFGETYSVFAFPPGRQFEFPLVARKGVRPSADSLALRTPERATETASLHFQILLPDGQAGEGAFLQVQHKDLNLFRSFETQARPGKFELEGLLPGIIDITVRHPDFQMLKLDSVALEAGERSDLGTLSFAPACRVSGTFRGLKAEALPAGAHMGIGQASGEYGSIEIAGASFKSSPLAPGRHFLNLSADHFLPIYKTLDLGPGENLELTLDLVPATLHLVRIRPADGDPSPNSIGARMQSGDGALVWSGSMLRQADGSFLARLSVLPGSYPFHASSGDGRTVSAQLTVHGLGGEPEETALQLSRAED